LGRRGLFGVVAALFALCGAALVVIALVMPQSEPPPPQPAATPPAAASAVAAPSASASASPPAAVGLVLSRSLPIHLDVPAIGVHSPLLQLGANPDNTVAVPPLEKDSKAGWFQYSPTPGQLGPAVLLGHVDSAQWGPGVFYRLGALAPGQTVDVTRSDKTVAVFAVDKVDSYPKGSFPSLQVYGNTPNAQLRLITCGGIFDPSARSYENNIVVYAHLVSTHPA
jgi:sortase (surface protein transpeptidase)